MVSKLRGRQTCEKCRERGRRPACCRGCVVQQAGHHGSPRGADPASQGCSRTSTKSAESQSALYVILRGRLSPPERDFWAPAPPFHLQFSLTVPTTVFPHPVHLAPLLKKSEGYVEPHGILESAWAFPPLVEACSVSCSLCDAE